MQTGLLVTGPLCQLRQPSSLPTLAFSSLTVYKHSQSGIVLDAVGGATLEDISLADNAR